jgi:hypothetical protein
MNENVTCTCDGWLKSWPQIERAQLVAARRGVVLYTGDTFAFCPWCGVSLAEPEPEPVEEESDEDGKE